jgi:hypothetical protein
MAGRAVAYSRPTKGDCCTAGGNFVSVQLPRLRPGRGLAKPPATRYNRGMRVTMLPRAPEASTTIPAADPVLLLEELATLRLENAALRAEMVALQARIRELEARMGQNSSNSSRPPSSDPPQAPAPPKAKTAVCVQLPCRAGILNAYDGGIPSHRSPRKLLPRGGPKCLRRIYQDLGSNSFDKRDHQAALHRSVRRLERLGYKVTVEVA